MHPARTHVLAIAAVLALAGAGAAFAVSRSSDEEHFRGEGRMQHPPRGGPHFAVRTSFAAAADFVGLSRAELLARLREGKSLAQIAEAEGKSVDGLKHAIEAALTARLDAMIDDLVHRARATRN
jgi:hypothetical protein